MEGGSGEGACGEAQPDEEHVLVVTRAVSMAEQPTGILKNG